jgi:hypothetical protein
MSDALSDSARDPVIINLTIDGTTHHIEII